MNEGVKIFAWNSNFSKQFETVARNFWERKKNTLNSNVKKKREKQQQKKSEKQQQQQKKPSELCVNVCYESMGHEFVLRFPSKFRTFTIKVQI